MRNTTMARSSVLFVPVNLYKTCGSHVWNPSTWEVEARVQGPLELSLGPVWAACSISKGKEKGQALAQVFNPSTLEAEADRFLSWRSAKIYIVSPCLK